MNNSRAFFWLSITLITVFLIILLGPILTPFISGAILAYIGNPIVNYLVKWKLPRSLAVVLVFLLIFSLIILLILILVPLLESQISNFIEQVPQILNWIQVTAIPWISKRFAVGQYLNISSLVSLLQSHWQTAGGVAFNVFKTISKSGVAVIVGLGNLLLIPVVTFYLLRDWQKLLKNGHDLLPRNIAPIVEGLAIEGDLVLGAFFRGQLLVMLGLGIIYATGLWLIGLNMALLIGLIAGLVSIVPYLGFIVGIGVAAIVSLFQFQDIIHLVYVLIVFLIGQSAESMLLTPLLVGDQIGLHPVAVIFAVLAGAQLFGFVGVLLALPVAAVLMVVLRYLKKQYMASRVYHGDDLELAP